MKFPKMGSLCIAAMSAFVLVHFLPGIAQAADKKIEIKIGSVTIKDTVHQWMINFKENVERRVGNRVDVRVFPAGQLGGIPREIEGIQLGTQQIVMLPPDFFVGIDKRFMVTSAPGLFRDLRHAQNSLHDPEFKRQFFSLGNDKGIQPIGIFAGDLAHYVSRKPIKKLSDFENRKIRVFASPMERLTMQKLGASPAPIPLLQALQALQRGTIDGMKSGFSIFTSFKYWSVTKHITRTTESTIAVMAATNPAFMAKLPADVRQILLEEAQHTDWQTLAFSEEFLKTNQGKWEKNGGTVYDLSKEDRAELTRRLKSVGDEVVKDLPPVKELFGILKTAAAKY
jgi:TRAP-type transport system periplasmic protein